MKVLDQFEKNYEREARESGARIPPANRPISVVRYRFSVLGVSKGSLSSYRYPDSLQSDIAFSSDEIEKALRSLTLLHIIEPRLCLPDGEILYFITDKYNQLISFAHDCLDLEYIITEMVEKLLINGENRRRKKLKEAAFNWFESSRGKKYCDGKLRELYHAVQSVDFNHNNCGLNKNELIYNYYFAPNLFRIACKAIRYIEEKHKDLLEEYNYLTEPMLNAAHYRPLLEAVNSISGISDGKCIKYPIQKSKEMELKSKLYVGMKLSDAYKILAENDVPNAHHNTVLFGNLGFSTSPITDDSYQEFRLVNKRRKKAKKSHLMYPWMN